MTEKLQLPTNFPFYILQFAFFYSRRHLQGRGNNNPHLKKFTATETVRNPNWFLFQIQILCHYLMFVPPMCRIRQEEIKFCTPHTVTVPSGTEFCSTFIWWQNICQDTKLSTTATQYISPKMDTTANNYQNISEIPYIWPINNRPTHYKTWINILQAILKCILHRTLHYSPFVVKHPTNSPQEGTFHLTCWHYYINALYDTQAQNLYNFKFHKDILMLSSNIKVYCSSALQIHRFNEKHPSWTQS